MKSFVHPSEVDSPVPKFKGCGAMRCGLFVYDLFAQKISYDPWRHIKSTMYRFVFTCIGCKYASLSLLSINERYSQLKKLLSRDSKKGRIYCEDTDLVRSERQLIDVVCQMVLYVAKGVPLHSTVLAFCRSIYYR